MLTWVYAEYRIVRLTRLAWQPRDHVQYLCVPNFHDATNEIPICTVILMRMISSFLITKKLKCECFYFFVTESHPSLNAVSSRQLLTLQLSASVLWRSDCAVV